MREENMQRLRFLSGNTLKLIAAIAMVVDHIGVIFFPEIRLLRMIGRLSFPIFAFMIAEGCKHTRNKLRYFLTVAALALSFQVVYFFALRKINMCIFVTFALSILMIYAMQYLKQTLFDENASLLKMLLACLIFFGLVIAAFAINLVVDMDYGFAGCMVPVFASIFVSTENTPDRVKRLDNNYTQVFALSIGLLALALNNTTIQFLSFLTVPLLLMYSGKRGRLKLKYFFYIFYPAHLVILYGISMLIK